MGTISDKLMRIINTKEDIRKALISKGYDVPTSVPFKEYAKMILDLPCKVDSFPDIEGIVARYSASGLTNEQMAANPVWVDKTGNGHDLQLKNLAWGGMSGVGGYADNFVNWEVLTDRSDVKIITNSFFISSVKKSSNSAILRPSKVGEIVPSIRIKVSGLIDGMGFVYMDSLTNIILHIPKDGIYTLPSYKIEPGVAYVSIKFDKIQESCNITIEQLPLYPGALVFDGVDDYGTCDNFPVLTKEKGYTVVALRQWITRGKIAQGLVSNVKNWLKDGAFLLEYRNIQADHLNKPISFGAIGSEMDLPHILTYQTSKSYNGVSITTGNFEGTDVLHVGKLAPTNVGTCINAAIRELVFLDHDATEEELTKIKDYFVKTYPWLFPDQAWTVVGKTNEDEDRATIANITGNGNDLVLSNFGFIEGSGYNEEGEHAGYLVTDGVDDMITSSAFQMGKDFTIVGDWKFIDNKKSGAGLVKGSSFYIYNTMIGLDLYINSGSVKNSLDGIKSINAACSDGRAYDRNWNEILANTGNVVGSGGILEVSSSGGRFDRIAFKNLAIYPRILSKDDCIKAYNYLQTLKAK